MIASENQCPVNHTVPARSLGAISRELLDSDFENIQAPDASTLDSLSTAELKLQTDAMTALVAFATTNSIQGEGFERTLAKKAMEDAKEGQYILEPFAEGIPPWLSFTAKRNLRSMRANKRYTQYLAVTETYRQAYYDRKQVAIAESEPDVHPENVYDSIENLLDTGINTFTGHAPGVIQAIDYHAKQAGLQLAERAAFVRKSDNILLSLAKLSIRDFERYTHLLNSREGIVHGSISLTPIQDDAQVPAVVYNTNVFRRMRELDPGKEYPDRFHEGCVGAVAIPGHDTVIKNLWGTYVGALEKAGFWEDETRLVTAASTD